MCLKVCRQMMIFTLIFTIGFSSRLSFAANGTSSGGGGGSTIQFKGQAHPFLLDRLTFNPGLAKRSDVTSNSVNPLPPLKNKGQNLSILPREGIREVLIFADNKLKAWIEEFKKRPLTYSTAISLGLMSMIKRTLAKMAFLRTPLRFKILDRYDLNPLLKQANPDIQMAVLYLPKYGAIISESPWDNVDLETQAGLLIHEAIRQIQGAFTYYDLTDWALQAITAKIMDVTPSNDESFAPFVLISPRFLNRCLVTGYQQPGILNSQFSTPDLALATLAVTVSSQLEGLIENKQNQKAIQISERNTSDFLRELVAAGVL